MMATTRESLYLNSRVARGKTENVRERRHMV